jgi:hypothetical protein
LIRRLGSPTFWGASLRIQFKGSINYCRGIGTRPARRHVGQLKAEPTRLSPDAYDVPMFTDEISGDGKIVIDGETVETVYYWLTVVPKAGPVIAEGSISGSENVMKKIKKAKTLKLILLDGPTVALRCHGGKNGTRWVKAMKA